MTIARITFWMAALLAAIGLPFCFFVFLAAARPSFPGVTEKWGSTALAIPVAVIVLSIACLILSRNLDGIEKKGFREWLLPMIFGSIVVGLLLLSKFG